MNKQKLFSALVAIAITVTVAGILAYFATEALGEYGSGLFFGTPVVCGALSVLIYSRKERKRIRESLSVSSIAGCISLLGFFAMGLEGAICLLMALPFVLPLFLIGGLIGHWISNALKNRAARDAVAMLLIAAVPLFMGFESLHKSEPAQRRIVSSVVIMGNATDVWREVIAFSPIPEPTEILFRTGIAYPTHAVIKGEGVGAIRYCHFSTGAFVEPITHWEEGRRLAFDVVEQPLPMTEVSPYSGIHPPHLDWAFESHRGEFLLNDLGDGRIELLGTTWYHTVMKPEWYWGWLGDEMIHAIHLRVLNHIKEAIETESTHKTSQ